MTNQITAIDLRHDQPVSVQTTLTMADRLRQLADFLDANPDIDAESYDSSASQYELRTQMWPKVFLSRFTENDYTVTSVDGCRRHLKAVVDGVSVVTITEACNCKDNQ